MSLDGDVECRREILLDITVEFCVLCCAADTFWISSYHLCGRGWVLEILHRWEINRHEQDGDRDGGRIIGLGTVAGLAGGWVHG